MEDASLGISDCVLEPVIKRESLGNGVVLVE